MRDKGVNQAALLGQIDMKMQGQWTLYFRTGFRMHYVTQARSDTPTQRASRSPHSTLFMPVDSNVIPTSEDSSTSTRGQGHSRARAAYVQHACSVCRYKKIRCDGKKPVCSGCIASNRGDQCSWVKDAPPPRRMRNEAFYQALKKRNEALKEYATYLESLLERCQREHGGLHDQSYLQRRPADVSMTSEDHPVAEGIVDEPPIGKEEDEEASIQGLIAPIQKLTLERGSLVTFGSTSVMRFRPVVHTKLSSRFKPSNNNNPTGAYVLLSHRSVIPTGGDSSIEWSRYLPPQVPLTRTQHDTALDLVFKFCTSFCLRIIPGLFLRDLHRTLSVPKHETPPKTAHYSPMLHNALLAVGLALLDEPLFNLECRRHFANEAKSYCELECSQPNLSTVHAVSFLGTFFSSGGDQTLGFVYFGMAARISQALGLDVDCSEWVKMGLIEDEDVQDRYWTFWTIFAQDVNWSLYVGRDFSVRAPTETAFKDMPVPYVDSDYDQMPFHHPPSGIPPRPGYLSKTFASTCELLVIARRIMGIVNGISNTQVQGSVIHEMVSDIDVQLTCWKDSLPPEVDLTPSTRIVATPHQLMLHMTYWWLFVILHRPYFHRKPNFIHSSEKEIDHIKLCKRATENIMDLVKIWRDLYTLRNTTLNVINPVFSAGTIYILSGVQAVTGPRVAKKELKHTFDSLKLCIQYLGEMGKVWEMAARVESILKSLVEERLKPVVEKRKADGVRCHSELADEGASIYTSNPPPLSRQPSGAKQRRANPSQMGPDAENREAQTPMVEHSAYQTSLTTEGHPTSTLPLFSRSSTPPLQVPMQPAIAHDQMNHIIGFTHPSDPSFTNAVFLANEWAGSAQYSTSNFDTTQHFAMLGGQHLSDVPFVGPISFNGFSMPVDSSSSSSSLGTQQVDLSDFDFGFLQAGSSQPVHDVSGEMSFGGLLDGSVPFRDVPDFGEPTYSDNLPSGRVLDSSEGVGMFGYGPF